MDEKTFHGLCKVREQMEKREWVCARNNFDDVMTEYLKNNPRPCDCGRSKIRGEK